MKNPLLFFAFGFWQTVLAGQCLGNSRQALGVFWWDAIYEAVGANLQTLGHPDQLGDLKGVTSCLNASQGGPMTSDQFGYTFEGVAGTEPGLSNIAPKNFEDVFVFHTPA